MTGRPRTTGEDIDRWLASAEAALDATEREARRVTRLVSVLFLAGAAVLIIAVAGAVRLPGGLDVTIAATVLLATVAGASGVLRWSLVRRGEIRRRRQELQSVVDDVREVLPIVARREHWDKVRYESVRVRLARFPVATR